MTNKPLPSDDRIQDIHAALFESANDAIFLFDQDSGFIDCNPKTLEMFGCDKAHIVGRRPYAETLSPPLQPDGRDSKEKATEKIAAAFQGHPQLFEWLHCRCDGTVFYAEVSLNAVAFEDNRYLLAVVRDITDKKQVESQLQNARRDWENIFHAIGHMALITDPDYRIIHANRTALEITGLTIEEICSKKCYEIFHQGEARLPKCPMQEQENTGLIEPAEMEIEALGKTFLLTCTPVFSKDGDLEKIIHIATDITQRKIARAALEESEDRYRSIFNESPLGILHYDAKGVIVDGNEKFFGVIGSSREKLIGLDMINQLRDTKLIEQVKNSLRTGTGYYEDYYTAVTSGKTTPVRVLFKGMRNDSGDIYGGVGMIEDITEKVMLEEQLRQSQKMEAIGRLAGGVAHDFNNLLSIINGYCELILPQIDRNGPLYRKFSQIMEAGDRAAALTRQLLAFSRKQILKPEVINANELIATTENMLRRLIGEDIDLEVRLAQGLHPIKADPGQLEQVLMNLSINARDAMPKGGRLTIETRNINLDEAYEKSHNDTPAGDYVMIAISDTGAGMDKDTLEHIFDPFYTTKEVGKGTGLGLSTVYGIIKQSGGSINVYSEPGQGSTFKIYLPKVAEKPTEEKPAAFSKERISGSETILVVEDDETVRDMTIQVLEELGYQTLGAPDGQSALKRIAGHAGPIDLMLTDVIMPQMNGRELAEKVSEIHPDIRVIYMSGYTDNAIVHHGVLDEGMDFLQKPVMIRELAETIRAVLDRP